jgi:hypothetical protein
MTTAQLQIMNVGEVYKEGKYNKLVLSFSREGKVQERKLVDIGDTKPVFAALKDAAPGEIWDIDMVKNGEFWNWTKATRVGAGAPVAATATKAQPIKSTYETPEERATRIRQSMRSFAVGHAVTYLPKGSAEEVLAQAEEFYKFITEPVPFDETDDDIPY